MVKQLKMSDVPDLNIAEDVISRIEDTLDGDVYHIRRNNQDSDFTTGRVGNSDEMRKAMEEVNDKFVGDLRKALLAYRRSIIAYVEYVIGVEYDYENFDNKYEKESENEA